MPGGVLLPAVMLAADLADFYAAVPFMDRPERCSSFDGLELLRVADENNFRACMGGMREDARRDPQWERIWSGEMKPAASAPGKPRPRPRQIFELEELNAINDWLAQARITDEASLATLFVGLSPEFVGRLPSAGNIADQLFLALGYLNDPGLKFGEKPPLYYVLVNARRHRRFEPDALAEMDRYLEKLKALP